MDRSTHNSLTMFESPESRNGTQTDAQKAKGRSFRPVLRFSPTINKKPAVRYNSLDFHTMIKRTLGSWRDDLYDPDAVRLRNPFRPTNLAWPVHGCLHAITECLSCTLSSSLFFTFLIVLGGQANNAQDFLLTIRSAPIYVCI